jgi:hypothetical protein
VTRYGKMKITRRQLRKLIRETFFVNPEGEAIDLTQGRPLFDRKRSDRLQMHPDKNIRDLAKRDIEHYKQALELASIAYGESELALTPDEEKIEDLHDEFGLDTEYGWKHLVREDDPDTDWYSFIEQLKPIVDKAIEAAITAGVTDDAELNNIMVNLPAYKGLYRRIDREAGWKADDLHPHMSTLADEAMIRHDINPMGRFVHENY